MSDVFKALADGTRRTILDELTARNGQTLFELCARLAAKHGLGSSRQAISQHLDVLEAAGLVETRREGRYKFHYLDTKPLEPIVQRWLNKAGKDKDAGSRRGLGDGAGSGTGTRDHYGREHHENPPGQRVR